jgi:hypothetical protein
MSQNVAELVSEAILLHPIFLIITILAVVYALSFAYIIYI